MRVAAIFVLASGAGCGLVSSLDGLKVSGDASALSDANDDTTAPSDGGGDLDAPSDGGLDVGASCEAGTCGSPAGFQPVLFTSGSPLPCPQSSSSSVDVVVDPAPVTNACTCQCTFQPSCIPQLFNFGAGNNCATVQNSNIQLDGGCQQTSNVQTPTHIAIGPFAPTNTCTNKLNANTKPQETSGRICSVADCSSCGAPTGFQLCYAHGGDVACPAATTKHSIGSSAQVACSACTGCSSTAKCKGNIELYQDNLCGLGTTSITVDGTCQVTSGNTLGSVRYTVAIDQGTCVAGTSTASTTVSDLTTICCP